MQFAIQIVPHGVRGLILAGILAAILSTIDSFLFNAATSVSYDFVKRKNKFKIWHHHVALVGISIFTVIASTLFDGNVVEVWRTLGSLSAACLLFPILLGQWRPGLFSESAYCWAVSFGCIGIVSWKILNKYYPIYELDEFYIGLLCTSLPLLPSLIRKKA
jgi:SSS family solute:Na+ symporter